MTTNLLHEIASIRIITFLLFSSMIFWGCRDGGTTQKSTQGNSSTTTTSAPAQNNRNANSSFQNASPEENESSSAFHYVCVNNCEGSGTNTAGNCPVCGEELVHNTSFHSGNQENDNSAPQIVGSDDNAFSSKIAPLGDPSASSSAPAVTGDASFHYICSAGCGGGGNAQGPCPSCGAALVHNAAFHANQEAPTSLGGSAGQNSGPKYPSVFNSPGAVRSAPSQNTSGTFHYLCSAGCGGGGNAQGACPSCGAALAHNDAYHL